MDKMPVTIPKVDGSIVYYLVNFELKKVIKKIKLAISRKFVEI